jgi:hypothetical protein
MPTRPRDRHILNVFPKLPMFLQIDLNGDSAALLILHKRILVMTVFRAESP